MAPVDPDRLRPRIQHVREENAEAYRQMVRFRNRAVHMYDEIDVDEVYSILESDLSDFEAFISAIVERYFPES